MKFKELKYKINDEVFGPNSIIGVESDGFKFSIKYIKKLDNRACYYTYTISVPVDDVEVIIDGE